MSMSENNFDLVVIGSGIAGQTAATTAAEAGLSVVLLEKTNKLGGSSRMSGGWFAFSNTPEQAEEGIEDSPELFLRDMLNLGQHLNDAALLKTYLANQETTYQWLKDHGVQIREVEISSGMSARRGHNTVITDVLSTLHESFTDAGGQTRLGRRAVQLLRDQKSGRVTGVRTQSPGGVDEIYTGRGGVVLATGGFSRSTELLKIFAPEQLAAIPYGGIGNTGDGLKMAWKLGAGMADMSFVSGTYGSHPETGEDFHELLTAYYMGAIIVNADGKRFIDESKDYKTLGTAVLRQKNGLGIEIFDAKVRAQSRRGIALKDIDTLEEIGHVYRADTLEHLAHIAGIAPDTLIQTVEDYNAAIAGNQDDEVGRDSLCNGQGELAPIDSPPYYAYPAKSLMTTTYCGLTINPSAQVIDVDGDSIEGLYAIGEVTGGFHGAAYMTGTSLGKGAVFGGIVGRNIAAQIYKADQRNPMHPVV